MLYLRTVSNKFHSLWIFFKYFDLPEVYSQNVDPSYTTNTTLRDCSNILFSTIEVVWYYLTWTNSVSRHLFIRMYDNKRFDWLLGFVQWDNFIDPLEWRHENYLSHSRGITFFVLYQRYSLLKGLHDPK